MRQTGLQVTPSDVVATSTFGTGCSINEPFQLDDLYLAPAVSPLAALHRPRHHAPPPLPHPKPPPCQRRPIHLRPNLCPRPLPQLLAHAEADPREVEVETEAGGLDVGLFEGPQGEGAGEKSGRGEAGGVEPLLLGERELRTERDGLVITDMWVGRPSRVSQGGRIDAYLLVDPAREGFHRFALPRVPQRHHVHPDPPSLHGIVDTRHQNPVAIVGDVEVKLGGGWRGLRRGVRPNGQLCARGRGCA